jgi:predicted O-linked N-acetylglucosamine transferase (SPINDLY family)
MEASPLMDVKAYTAAIEAAYEQMWQCWCDAHPA